DPVEHKDVNMFAKETVVEGLVKAERGQVFIQGVAQARAEFELDLVVLMPHCAFVIVPLRTKLLPQAALAEINAFVFGGVDVTGPEQADVAMRKNVLSRLAAEGHVQVVRRGQLEAGPALQVESRGRRLMELRRSPRDFFQLHGSVARLEEDLAAII